MLLLGVWGLTDVVCVVDTFRCLGVDRDVICVVGDIVGEHRLFL
jgi:hypothetical protein